MKFTEYTLKQLLVIKNGRDHKSIGDGPFPVYGSGGIMRYCANFIYDKPSILLPRKGSLDNIQYANFPFWTVDTLYYTEVNEKIANPYYLFRYLKLLDLSNLDTGTGVPSMTFDSYYNIKVNLPNLSEQNRIADLLIAIDRKIALNREINRNLEAMARQLYDYWFVQFDFPDENGRPYKSSGGKMVWNEKLKREIPKGWKEINLGDYLQCITERIQPSDKDDYYTPIEVLPRKQMSFSDFVPIEEATSGLCRYKEGDILLSNRRVYFHKVCIAPSNGITRDTVIILRPQKGLLGYSFQLVFSDHFISYATQHSYGSEQPVLSWEAAKKYKVVRPTNNIDAEYSIITNNIVAQILSNEREIRKLTNYRDMMLPLLMNGQVSVMPPEVNCDLSHD